MLSFLYYILTNKMYSMMTVPELKEELRKRKASVVGKKAVLIQRLAAYDRNANFGGEDVEEDDVFEAPSIESFRDINANSVLPKITKEHIQAFVERFQTQFKGRQMYESQFLLTARVAVDGDFTYIQGQCKAQMKKLLNPKSFVSKATAHGQIQKSVAIWKCTEWYDLPVKSCRIFISESHPFLGASPDGLLGEDTVIEVRCPYVSRNYEVSPLTVPYLEEVNREYILKNVWCLTALTDHLGLLDHTPSVGIKCQFSSPLSLRYLYVSSERVNPITEVGLQLST